LIGNDDAVDITIIFHQNREKLIADIYMVAKSSTELSGDARSDAEAMVCARCARTFFLDSIAI
jgi:hypothetical protein